VSVGPGDIIRLYPQIQDREAGFIRLSGQFVRPGTYDIRRGDTLSALVARAGGLTKQAYPFGAFFTREGIKKTEEENNQRLSRELNAAILDASVNGDVSGGTLSAFRQLTRDVSKIPFTGRVVIEADPAVLAIRPERDIVLQPGDSLHMPKRPGSVFVSGEVLNPGALQFRPGMDAGAYISQAGGLQKNADRGKVFVVFANGEARPLSLSAFNFSSLQIPPGSAIVVPKDITTFNLLTVSEALASFVSSIALTAASLAVIGN
jgi:polysaccharide export outer membrane protein